MVQYPPFTEQTVLNHSRMSLSRAHSVPYHYHSPRSIATTHPLYIHNHYWMQITSRLCITVHVELSGTAMTAVQESKVTHIYMAPSHWVGGSPHTDTIHWSITSADQHLTVASSWSCPLKGPYGQPAGSRKARWLLHCCDKTFGDRCW